MQSKSTLETSLLFRCSSMRADGSYLCDVNHFYLYLWLQIRSVICVTVYTVYLMYHPSKHNDNLELFMVSMTSRNRANSTRLLLKIVSYYFFSYLHVKSGVFCPRRRCSITKQWENNSLL